MGYKHSNIHIFYLVLENYTVYVSGLYLFVILWGYITMSNVFKLGVFETQVYETYASLAWADKPRINMSYNELTSILPLIWSTKQMEF